MWSRTPDDYEVQALQEYFTSLFKQNSNLKDLYFYVNLNTGDGAIEVLHYPDNTITAMAEALDCTEREALYCCGHFPGFLNELRGIYYWSGIGGYKKYSITTRTLNKREEESFHDATIYHIGKEEVIADLKKQGFDIHTITDVDDEV